MTLHKSTGSSRIQEQQERESGERVEVVSALTGNGDSYRKNILHTVADSCILMTVLKDASIRGEIQYYKLGRSGPGLLLRTLQRNEQQ